MPAEYHTLIMLITSYVAPQPLTIMLSDIYRGRCRDSVEVILEDEAHISRRALQRCCAERTYRVEAVRAVRYIYTCPVSVNKNQKVSFRRPRILSRSGIAITKDTVTTSQKLGKRAKNMVFAGLIVQRGITILHHLYKENKKIKDCGKSGNTIFTHHGFHCTLGIMAVMQTLLAVERVETHHGILIGPSLKVRCVNSLDGLFRGHMAARVEGVRGRSSVHIESWLDAHTDAHH